MSTPNRISPIERQIDVTRLPENTEDVFTNSSSFWRPGEYRIFGGFAIAQSLRAAQQTIDEGFSAHSLRGSFIFAGKSDRNVFYQVEKVRDGKGFCTRLVRASQGKRPIFICIIGFTKGNSGRDQDYLEHSSPMPLNIPEPENPNNEEIEASLPYINRSVGIVCKSAQSQPEDKRIHQWIKACGPLSPSATLHTQQAALAFMSDSYFLVGVPHSHEIWNFVNPPISEFSSATAKAPEATKDHTRIQRPHLERPISEPENGTRRVSMMVSLDHTIYFHNVENLRADEWLLSEIHSSWAGNGRGLVHQKMWTKEGTLVATCIQEGIVRLQPRQSVL